VAAPAADCAVSRASIISAMALGVAALVASSLGQARPLLVWNATASAPLGLYGITAADEVHVGDLVVATAPARLAAVFAERGYLPMGVPLIKRVAALAGSTVCRVDTTVLIEGNPVAEALRADSAGRPLPAWSGCHRLQQDEVFLLVPDVPASLDGRYFGPVSRTSVLGRAVPIWTSSRP